MTLMMAGPAFMSEITTTWWEMWGEMGRYGEVWGDGDHLHAREAVEEAERPQRAEHTQRAQEVERLYAVEQREQRDEHDAAVEQVPAVGEVAAHGEDHPLGEHLCDAVGVRVRVRAGKP